MLKFAVTSEKCRPAEGRISPLNRVLKKPRILSERIDNTDKSENTERIDNTDKSENTERIDNTDKSENSERIDNTDKSENTDRIDNTDKSENTDSSENSPSSDKLSYDGSIQLLFKRHKVLQKANEDFDNFLEVVSKDMLMKTECLKKVKNSAHAGISNKTEANLQLFMLSQYNHRISRFRTVALSSLHNISKKMLEQEEVEGMVVKHMACIAKMKRRMKQMLDVAEKYAVEDILDTMNLLQQMSHKIQLAPIESVDSRALRLTRRSQSMSQLGTDCVDGGQSRRSLSPMSSRATRGLQKTAEGSGGGVRKLNTLKSFSDHLAVLTKTYTNRR